MRKHIGLLTALAMGITAFVSMPKTAHAEDFSLHIEGGAALPMSSPQDSIFNTGPSLGAKGMFALTPNLSIGPSLSAMYFPRVNDSNNQNAGVLWQMGGSIRLQGNRSSHFNGLLTGWSPWVDADATMAYTGHLPLPAFDVGVGEEVALDNAHAAWFGPYLRYTHAFETANTSGGSLLEKRDINIFQGGVSISFDFPPHVYHDTKVLSVHEVRTYYVPVPQKTASITTVQAATPETFSLTEHVFFDHDSSVLRWESKDKLDQVAKKLAAKPDMMIAVQGHASVDGQLEHNQKLSQARADAVVDYLVAHGIKREQLRADSFGVSVPATTDTSKEGLERSRRVEFTIVFTSFRK